MPAAQATLVLNNHANVAKTFTLASPAAGYGSIAEYVLREGAVAAVFPRITFQANRNRTSNQGHMKLSVPSSITDPVTGLVRVTDKFEIYIKAVAPDNYPEDQKDHVVAFAVNALQLAMTKAFLRNGESVS